MTKTTRANLFPLAFACGLAAGCSSASAHPHVWVATQSTAIFENGALTGLRYTWLFDEMYTASAIDGLDKNNDGKVEGPELDELTKVNIEGLKEFEYFSSVTMAGKPVPLGDPKDYAMEVMTVETPPGPQMVAGSGGGGTEAAPAEKPTAWQRFKGWIAGLFGGGKNVGADTRSATPVTPDKTLVLALRMTLPLKEPIPASGLKSEKDGFQFTVNDGQMFIWFEPTPKDGISVSAGAPKGCHVTFVDQEPDEQQKKLQEAFGRLGSTAMGSPTKSVAVVCD